MATPSHLTVTETDLAKALGVARDLLKKIRRDSLTQGKDWLLGEETHAIEITISGLKKIRAALDLPPDPPALPWRGNDREARLHHGDPDAKNGHPRRVALTVVKVARGNKMIVECLTEEGNKCRLRVRDNTNFIPGMKVPTCVHVELDRYDYEGRLPRRRGRLK